MTATVRLIYPVQAPYAMLYVKGKAILVTHGQEMDTAKIKEMAGLYGAGIVISGHTHIPRLEQENKTLFLEGAAPEQVLQKLLGPDFVELHRKKVGFHCLCSKDKLEQILISLGEKEIRDIIESQERAEIECHFCADKYCFEGSELPSILQAAKDQSHR